MEEDLVKFAERAGDVLVEFSKQQQAKLKPPEEAAKDLLESEKNIKSVESIFLSNSVDILYNYILMKFPDEAASNSKNVEKLLVILKGISGKEDKDSTEKSRIVYKQLIIEMQKIEDKIQANHPEYQKKIT